MRKSFFSGHVSFAATATFFAVKAYTDYHQIKGFSRIALYSLAAVPPLITGYFRVESGRHFKTDVLVGLLSGATCGILVPELFRDKGKRNGLSFRPYYMQDGGGVSLAMKL
jgi:membrane-associated phospholipid phosphatase